MTTLNLIYGNILRIVLPLLLVIIFQSIVSDVVSIQGIRLDLPIFILVYISLTQGPKQGVILGFLFGLLLDVFSPERLGLGALIKCSLGFAVGNFKDTLFLESLYSKGLIVFLCVIVNDLIYYLASTGLSLSTTLHVLLSSSLPSAVYTLVVGMLIFVFLEKRVSQKLRTA